MTAAPPASTPFRGVLRAIAEGLLTGTVAAALAALPAAWRVAHAGAPWPRAWLALAGSFALVLGPLSAALRAARPTPRWALSIPIAVVFAAAPLMWFAKLLKVSTHYWPLSAVTFAIVAAAIVLGTLAVALRLLNAARAEPSAARTLARTALGLLGAASVALALGLSANVFSSAFSADLLDATLGLGLSAAAAVMPLPPRAGRAGWVVWLALGLAGAFTLRAAPSLAANARKHAPVLLGPGTWLAS